MQYFLRGAIVLICFAGLATHHAAAETVRFATFNASLNRNNTGELLSDLANPNAEGGVNATVANRIQQAHNVAEILQRIDADVLLINEFDFDNAGTPTASQTASPLGYASNAANLFQNNFLAASHGGGATGRTVTAPVNYAFKYTPNTNTGIASGFDLNRNGSIVNTPAAAGYGDDALGFGSFPGQFGFTIYSKHEIVGVRSFQKFLWKDMPGANLPDDAITPAPNDFYSPSILNILPLSSKNHVDVTVRVNGQDVHFLAAHPTPPVFDGPEDRNGKRNHDEIRLFDDYVDGANYLYDDSGVFGGLPANAKFVIAGDYNADPNDGDSLNFAIRQLTNDPSFNTSSTPQSAGAADPIHQNGINLSHINPPSQDTADFADTSPGNLRVDYVLPSNNLPILDNGVFWPAPNDPNFSLVGTFGNPNLFAGFPTSDHKAVWVDVEVVPEPSSVILLLTGVALVCFQLRRRSSR